MTPTTVTQTLPLLTRSLQLHLPLLPRLQHRRTVLPHTDTVLSRDFPHNNIVLRIVRYLSVTVI